MLLNLLQNWNYSDTRSKSATPNVANYGAQTHMSDRAHIQPARRLQPTPLSNRSLPKNYYSSNI